MPDNQRRQSTLTSEILEYLRAQLGDSVSIVGELTRLQGGFDTDTYALEIENAPAGFPRNLVFRHFRHAREADRVVRESTVQNSAARAGHPVPAVPIDSFGELIGNRPFFFMERLPGSSLGEALLKDESLLHKYPSIMAKIQADLHSLNSTGLRRSLESKGVDISQLSPSRSLHRINAIAEQADLTDLSELSRWLVENYPEQPTNPVICHGDFHPNNILIDDGKVTGLIDWSSIMFSHSEYDIAISRVILSIGPPDDVGVPKEELDKLLAWGLSEYLKECHARLALDDMLIDYYAALRVSNAYAKVIGKQRGVDLPYVAHDGYAWDRPDLFALVTKIIGETTGIEIVSTVG